MSFIITTRNPRNHKLVIITDGDDDSAWSVAEFATEDQATDAASQTAICKAWGYEVVEVSLL